MSIADFDTDLLDAKYQLIQATNVLDALAHIEDPVFREAVVAPAQARVQVLVDTAMTYVRRLT